MKRVMMEKNTIMKSCKRTGLLLLMLVAVFSSRAQQDVQFSQYVFNPLFINPAYSGYRGDTYISGIYRQQWVGMPGAPKTAAASVDWLVPGREERMAFSAKVMSDKLGPQSTLYASGGYAYRIPLDDLGSKRLCIGFGVGITQYSIDGTAFKYVDNNDAAVPVTKTSKLVPDANVGVYYYTPKWYFGVAANDLLATSTADIKYSWSSQTFKSMERSAHLYLTSGFVVPLSPVVKLKPSILWKEDFKGPSNVDINAFLLLHDILWLGGSYRTGLRIWNQADLQSNLENKDAFAAIVEVYATPTLRIGYAYDFSVSKMNPYQSGTHEISFGMRVLAKKAKRALSPRYF
ncbi:PorP/SprF family type IX secretion system membrane protein [Filimonas lacunae]|nr:type IX secretion system membrane protein PorP/SprF [Filimonas lacunae]